MEKMANKTCLSNFHLMYNMRCWKRREDEGGTAHLMSTGKEAAGGVKYDSKAFRPVSEELS
jgi:hypothetical protein